MRDEWFCSGPQGKAGPLTFQQLKRALKGNPYANHIFIWHETLPDWVRVRDYRGLGQIDGSDRPRQQARSNAGKTNIIYGPEAQEGRGLSVRRFSILGILVGLLLMILGCVVFYFGMVGEFTLVTELVDINSPEIDASVGVVFFIAGIIVIWATRHSAT
jgi:hypothetical protein